MFLNWIKNYFLKRKLKNSLQNVKNSSSEFFVQKVGVLIDASVFTNTDALLQQLISNGIFEKNISVLVYSESLKEGQLVLYPAFSPKDVSWNAVISNKAVVDFMQFDFDLLLNYYDTEKTILLYVTQQTKARFKVGFSTIDPRLNHLMLSTKMDNYLVFVSELFKYLKILNKI